LVSVTLKIACILPFFYHELGLLPVYQPPEKGIEIDKSGI
jgi:hypothetical protein